MNDLGELPAIIAQLYGLSLGQARQLDGGDECLVWSVPSHQGPLVVRSSPCWRSPERLAWTHRLMLSLQAVLPQVIAPLRALDGSTLFRYNDRSVALFPYVVGAPFDRENPKLRQEAATFLARLHATLLNRAPDSAGLQRHLLIGAPPLPPAPDPDSLIDLELDIWHTTVLQKSASLGTNTQQTFPVEVVREPSTFSRSSAGLLFPLRAGVASRDPSPAANATKSHPDLQSSR